VTGRLDQCVECAAPIADGDAFCSSCGESLATADAPSAGLSRGRLAALAAVSAIATGLVLGSALGGPNPLLLAAALAQGATPVATAPATPAGTPRPGGLAPLPGGSGRSGGASGSSSSGGGSSVGAASVGGGAPAAPARPATTQPESPSAPTPPSTTIKPSKVKHVFVIVLSSPGYDATFGPDTQLPYLSGGLRPQGALLTNYSAVSHSDLPNYIAMVSGQAPNPSTESECTVYSEFATGTKPSADGLVPGAGCVYPVDTLGLADQVGIARLRWGAYAEDMTNGTPPAKSCRRPGPNAADPTQVGRAGDEYAARHNPFVYFHSLLDLGDCTSKDLPLDRLKIDLAKESTTPNYAFVAPGLCHDGSENPCADGTPGGPAAADAFLREWVPRILASPAYKRDGMLAITFAHGAADDPSGGGGRVGALLLSRWVKAGASSTGTYDHYSLLRSVEDLLGLPHLGKAAAPEARGFARELLPSAF
jgi:hypothetical protein